MAAPLADRMRPATLEDMVGQQHLLGPDKALRHIIEGGQIPNLIFYGPSGVGKTTLARIIAQRTDMRLHKLNGTSATTADIKAVVDEVDTLAGMGGILLYLDEIQYFNKKQQQTLLEHIENGRITLIASTTENPYFYVYSAILSRATVFEFKAVDASEIERAVRRAFDFLQQEKGVLVSATDEAVAVIASSSGGDVRKAINAVELCVMATPPDGEGAVRVTEETARQLAQRSAMRYDRGGDAMYDAASALHKSIRGSDPDAALHYLARFLEAGDLITPCRRLLCAASEDVGLAYPQAITIVKSCADTAMQLGLPEAQLPLAQAAILLATAPKSNSVCTGIMSAWADVKAGRGGDVPRELQNVHADSAGLERDQGYKYPHNYGHHWVRQQYLPDAIKNARYYHYGDNKTEQAAKSYWEKIKGPQ